MEIIDFIEKLVDVFDETDASEITGATKFKTLDEWSSLTALSIIAFADEEYDVTLNNEDLKSAETIEDLFNVISSKK